MSIIGTVRDALQPSERADTGEKSEGAYWCHDCSERVLDTDVDGDEPPACPECGDDMAFERSPDSGACAC
jgi:Zn finger protein HypA/HybF involved in hydrogenase expression